MIIDTIRQLPAIFAPPRDLLERNHTGFAGGQGILLFYWAALVVVRVLGFLVTGRVLFPTKWSNR